MSFFLCQNGRVCDDCPVRNHEESHVEHKGQCGIIDGIFDGEFFPFYFGIFDSAAGHANQSNDGNGKDCQERSLAVQMVLYLNAHIRTYCHTNGNGECKLLMPSVIFVGGSTSLASVIVAEPQTEYTTPIYRRMTIKAPKWGMR